MENKNLVLILCDFLQVWIHQILYQHELYPLDTFETRKMYDILVYMSIHPKVCEYINDFITSILPMIEQGKCKLIALKISSPLLTMKEKKEYIMEIEEYDLKKSLSSTDISNLQYYFRSCLLKMNAIPSLLSKNDHPLTFQLFIQSTLPNQEIITWVPKDDEQDNKWLTWQQLLPIKTISVNYLKINFYVIDTNIKRD